MTIIREAAHRWAVMFYFVVTLTAAALRHSRRAKHRRRMWKRVEAWPW